MSHRDFARSFERAIRRAAVPIGFSAGFSPHPKISWVGAAPTGVASLAEYVEIGLSAQRDPEQIRQALHDALPIDLDISECVEAKGGSLPERIDTSIWQLEFPDAAVADVQSAADALLATETAMVERMTKNGLRQIDVRAAIVALALVEGDTPTMHATVRHTTPVVRPDDLVTALRDSGLPQGTAPRAVRIAQGVLDADGNLLDPLAADR